MAFAPNSKNPHLLQYFSECPLGHLVYIPLGSLLRWRCVALPQNSAGTSVVKTGCAVFRSTPCHPYTSSEESLFHSDGQAFSPLPFLVYLWEGPMTPFVCYHVVWASITPTVQEAAPETPPTGCAPIAGITVGTQGHLRVQTIRETDAQEHDQQLKIVFFFS